MILGLQMASKAFIIICGVELGKPHLLPEYSGRAMPGSKPQEDEMWTINIKTVLYFKT